MPRSSRHKSSKHSSRDARDYSDSEKESSLKERKAKEESSARVSKESGSGDKRKLDLKDNKEYYDSVNGEYFEEHTSSKRRKEKIDDSVNDRWNGGEDDRGESSRKSNAASDKSRRRDEGEGEETKKSSGKSEGKHRESSRRESKEFERDRDRDRDKKYKEGKSERFVDNEDHHGSKMVFDKADLNSHDHLQSPESENYLERRARRKREDYGDGDGDINEYNTEDISFKGGKQKEEKCKDEKHRDKHREDIDRDKHRGDKQIDDRSSREHTNTRSDEKDASESRWKKSKVHDNDHDHEYGPGRDSEHDGYRDRSHDYEREYERGRDRDRRDYEHDRYHERDWDRDRSRDRDKDRSRGYYYDRDRSKSDRQRDLDRDGSYLDDQSLRYKDSRERKKSPDDHDDLSDTKSRGMGFPNSDLETKSNRAEPDTDRMKSQSRQAFSSHGAQDEFRHISEQRTKTISSREATDFSGGSERGSKYRSSEKSTKVDDDHLGELSVERFSTTKASPMSLVERSPSSTSHERRFMNRSTTRRSIEIEETGQKSNAREISASEDRLSRDLPPDKPLAEDSSHTELSFHNKTGQTNSSFPPRPDSRGGGGSPLVGSLEEENRVNINTRYKRSGDPIVARGQGNAWRGGAPNWPSPVPNGFIPFQHGPPHGGFQSMMPQFPSPSFFWVRPSMEMSHSGNPYHFPDAERFSGHLRPLGWQNMMDGSGPSNMHGWDVSNGVFRDETHVYGGPEWDHNRNRMHGRGWESSGADTWKIQNGNASMDVSAMSQKDDYSSQGPDDDVPAGQMSLSENNRAKSVEAGSNITSPVKELSKSSPKVLFEKASDHSTSAADDDVDRHCRYYLSKLDISIDLAGPELHSQCMSILIKEQSEPIDEETPVLVNLKDNGKAVAKSSTSLSTVSLFPATNSSVFQRAMDLYKKQRVEMNGLPTVNDERIAVLPSFSPDDVEKEEDPVSISDAKTSIASMSASAMQKSEAMVTADAEKKTDEHVSALSPDNSAEKLEVPSEDLIHGEPILDGNQMNASITVLDISSSEDMGGDGDPCCDGDSTSKRNNGPENEEKVKCDEEERGACGNDADEGLVVNPDASEKVSGQLIPDDTHESESVLSRIHHSPENTH